jgi:hypothetical protein
MGKIVKTLKTTVPLIVMIPGVANMLANSPEIASSWKKAFDGDSADGGSKMDYQDYMNILQVLNVAAGATNIARNTYRSGKASTKLPDKIAVEVMGKTQIAQLRKMANFTFTRHKSINLPEDRLAKIEAYMRKRAVRLLALTRTRSAKKKEDKEER